jgi:hypothetical protein
LYPGMTKHERVSWVFLTPCPARPAPAACRKVRQHRCVENTSAFSVCSRSFPPLLVRNWYGPIVHGGPSPPLLPSAISLPIGALLRA